MSAEEKLTEGLRDAIGWAAEGGLTKRQIIAELREMIEEVEAMTRYQPSPTPDL